MKIDLSVLQKDLQQPWDKQYIIRNGILSEK